MALTPIPPDAAHPVPDPVDWSLAAVVWSIPYRAADGYFVVHLSRSADPADSYVSGWDLARGTRDECAAWLADQRRRTAHPGTDSILSPCDH